MHRSMEQTLAFRCAPALAGIKPANLISCDLAEYPSLDGELERLNEELNPSESTSLPSAASRARPAAGLPAADKGALSGRPEGPRLSAPEALSRRRAGHGAGAPDAAA